jgi:hypothetical protein
LLTATQARLTKPGFSSKPNRKNTKHGSSPDLLRLLAGLPPQEVKSETCPGSRTKQPQRALSQIHLVSAKNIKKYCLRLVSAILTFEFQTIRVYLPFTLNSVHKVLLPKQLFTNLIIHNHTNSLQKKCLPPRHQFPPPLLPRK